MRSRRRWLALLPFVAILGCHETPPAHDATPTTPLGSAFDPGATGTIVGRVLWEGPIPQPPVLKAYANYLYPLGNQFMGEKPNPHAPVVDPQSRGVRHAVVYLDKVDPARSRPWDHPPPRVVLRSRALYVQGQGAEPRITAMVRRGTDVEFVNEDVFFHLVQARGEAFFSLPLVIADRPTPRRLDRAGIVELSAGAGQFWVRGYLFVSEHPYQALTDDGGRFELNQVPEGEYELVAWMPNWHIERVERDPEVGLVSRLVFAPAAAQRRVVRVERGATRVSDFAWREDDFEPD